MSFYEIESGLSSLVQGVDRKKADQAAHLRLKRKLQELRDCGLNVDLSIDADEADDDIVKPLRA